MDSKFNRTGSDVKSILKQFGREFKVNDSVLNYALVSFKTFIQNDDGKMPISNEQINDYLASDKEIIQEYEINIFKRKNSFYPILIQIQSNENNTDLKALIYTERIPQNANLEALIKNTILNICAYRGIIIGLGWNDISQDIAQIAQELISQNPKPEFYTLQIANLKEPIIQSGATRLLISKNKNKAILSFESQLLSGGFLKIHKDEITLSYKIPSYDSPWRNIYGEIFGVRNSYPIGISAGEGIEILRQGENILYRAQMDGFLSIVNNKMLISDTVILNSINQSNIKNIHDQEIETLIVKNDNLTKDVIASGLKLDIPTLKIIGNVGSVEINAQNLFINGQVHLKSNIKANKASILHFKGNLKAKVAEIRHCEHANIECDNIVINYINGSKIYCNTAKIGRIASNNSFFVQQNMQISELEGTSNEFIMHPCLYGESKAALDFLNEKMQNLNKLRGIISTNGNEIYEKHLENEQIYENLNAKNASFDENLYDWEGILNKHLFKKSSSKKVVDAYNNLVSKLDSQKNTLQSEINSMISKMFQIEIEFEKKCKMNISVRFINFYGTSKVYSISANESNPIKKIKLSNQNNQIKINLFKD